MRKSPIAIALSFALLSGSVLAQSFDQALNKAGEQAAAKQPSSSVKPENVSNFDKNITAAKQQALSGAIYEDEQLKELRDILTETSINELKQKRERVSFPMEADEIRERRAKINALQKAAQEPMGKVNFKMTNFTYNPDDNKPIVLSLSGGYSAQIEFYDASGQPWSISKDGVVGNSEAFSKKVMGEKRHIASFTLSQKYEQSNAIIVLDGLSSSIPILLKGSEGEVDGRMVVTLPRMGPNAEIQPVFNHELENVSPELVKLQGGDAPIGSKPLRVAGIDNAEAWYDGESLFLALPGRLLLPPPQNSSISPTGRFLYKIAPATHISVSVNGVRKSGTIEDLYRTEIRRERTVFDKGVE